MQKRVTHVLGELLSPHGSSLRRLAGPLAPFRTSFVCVLQKPVCCRSLCAAEALRTALHLGAVPLSELSFSGL